MKNLKKILFTIAMVIGLAFSVSAQKQGPKERPPKQDPPKIEPRPKDRPPRGNPPKDDRPKKPEMSLYLGAVKIEDIV
ncbi:MAG TPA: hypothetical protein VFZ23_02110 [Pyrinomonadaceae bacterium]